MSNPEDWLLLAERMLAMAMRTSDSQFTPE
jgi:hypothetical protein